MEGSLMRRRDFLAGITVAGAGLHSTVVLAQPNYPKRTIRMVVPFAPGGGVDSFGRLIAEKLKSRQGATIIIDNRSGGNGTIGGNEVRRAQPDGYTLLFSASTHILARQVMREPLYDPVADFTPIARAGEAPLLVVMAARMPQKTIAEVVADQKQNPGKWTFGVSALGSAGHLATISFIQLAGVDFTVAAYRGTSPALNDVAGGHIQLMIDPLVALWPMAKGGKVKALGVASDHRSKLAPEVPTAAESGMPGLNVTSWYGVWGPKNMPAELVVWVNNAINEAVQALEKEGRLDSLGIDPVNGSPKEFASFIDQDLKRSADLLRAANFQPE
jgi:tripartite-type tricarboxylate transporter receptor subunit TctC